MQRYNIFYQVHKGLRAMLYETALLLQQTDFTGSEETEPVIAQLEVILELFDKHAYTEDSLIFSAIEKYEAGLSKAFEQEHAEDHELGQRLRGLITVFFHSVASGDKDDAGRELNRSFIDFMNFNLKHMAKEETLINKALWRYYTDEQLKGITHQIVCSMPPEPLALYSKWMIRGLSNTEIINWLKEIKNNAPDAAFRSLMSLAQRELAPHRWLQVLNQLSEGAMLA
jgi:hemerythrin-like domain-containing protein